MMELRLLPGTSHLYISTFQLEYAGGCMKSVSDDGMIKMVQVL